MALKLHSDVMKWGRNQCLFCAKKSFKKTIKNLKSSVENMLQNLVAGHCVWIVSCIKALVSCQCNAVAKLILLSDPQCHLPSADLPVTTI